MTARNKPCWRSSSKLTNRRTPALRVLSWMIRFAETLANQPDQRGALEAEPDPEQPPFRFLHEATADTLAKHLAYENPQIVAVVVSHLPAKRAADLVTRFPPKLQVDVLKRVADLDRKADPEVLRALERELELRFSDELRLARNRHAGLAAVSSILQAAGTDRHELFHNLAHLDRAFATALDEVTAGSSLATRGSDSLNHAPQSPAPTDRSARGYPWRSAAGSSHPGASPAVQPAALDAAARAGAPTIPFRDLSQFSDQQLAQLFAMVDPHVTILALLGAEPSLIERLMNQLPSRDARDLRRKLHPRRTRSFGRHRSGSAGAGQTGGAACKAVKPPVQDQSQAVRRGRLIVSESNLGVLQLVVVRAREWRSSSKQVNNSSKEMSLRSAAFNFEDIAAKADGYLGTVREQAEAVLAEARQQADVLRKNAHQEGRQDALREATQVVGQKLEQQLQTLMPAMEQAVESLQRAEQSWKLTLGTAHRAFGC